MKNVKFIIRKIIAPLFFACILFPQISFSQGMEFLWAKKLGGGGGTQLNPDFINKITSVVMDSVGNTYVLGNFCSESRIDGDVIIPDSIRYGGNHTGDYVGVFVAKFDTLGNLQWKKCSRTKEGSTLNPIGMELKDDKLTIGFYGLLTVTWVNETGWLFFFDTMIYDVPSDNPYSLDVNDSRWYTFFVTFDLDGGMKDYHYIDFKNTRLYPRSRFVFDDQNNICLFASLEEDIFFNGEILQWSPTHMPHIVVDGDTTKRFMFDFYDGDTTKPHCTSFFTFLKFDTNWNVVAYKRLIDTITNTSFDLEAAEGRTYEALPKEMSLHIDEENNMYVSGLMNAVFSLQDTAVHYYINLDSTHHLTVESALGAYNGIPFIIKYDPDGNVIWSQQLYYQSPRLYNYIPVYTYQSFGEIDSNRVYYLVTITSDAYAYRGFTDSIYEAYPFFDENHKIPIETAGFSQGYSVCIAYDRMTGSLIDYFQFDAQNDSAYVSVRTPMIIDSNYFRLALHISKPPITQDGEVWYTMARRSGEVKKSNTIFGMFEYFNMVHPHGFVLRIGCSDHIYNDYFDFSGNDVTAIVLYYDSTLDCRRPPVIIPQDSTSISSASSPQFTLFPNPASSMVRVMDTRSGDLMPDITEISVFSIQGKKMLSLSNASQFDISNLATGTYIVKIVSKTDAVEYLKLIKNNK